MTKGRRVLSFGSVLEVPGDAASLVGGHRTLGRWSMGQICNHLAATLTWSMDGFPARQAPWVVCATFGKLAISRMSRTGRIPEGFPLPKKHAPGEALDAAEEAGRLAAAVARFAGHSGAFAPHPFIGRMTRERYERYHC